MAVLVEVNHKDYVYLAIVDSASPFLTAPNDVIEEGYSKPTVYPPSQEQYGDSIGSMNWRRVSSISVCDKEEQEYTFDKIVIGVPSFNVIEETGGIYFGLMREDKYHPTIQQQFGYSSFCLDYREATLTLSKQSLIHDNDADAMPLFDLSIYGSNVFHYAVECSTFELQFINSKSTTLRILCSLLKRPVVVVVDTGLTGCVVNDSLWQELQQVYPHLRLQDVTGARLELPNNVVLESNAKYWTVSSFRLPWFDYPHRQHPHVIAAGNTFLSQVSSLTVDTDTRRILIR